MAPRAHKLPWAVLGWVFFNSPVLAQGPFGVENDRFQVTLLEEGECCPSRIELAATDHAAGSTIRVVVEGRVQQLEALHLYGERLVVEGTLPWGGTNLLIADLRTGRQEERIWAYELAISPSGRFVVYRGHYPRAADPGGRRSIVLLYDLAKSAEENRSGERREYPCANQGVPIFPEESAVSGDPCISEVSDRLWVSPFLWSEDETRIALLECTPDWGRCDLVLLDLSRTDRAPATWRRRLDLTPFLRREGLYQFTGEPGDPVRLSVRSLAWKDPRTLMIDPHPESGLLSIELELP